MNAKRTLTAAVNCVQIPLDRMYVPAVLATDLLQINIIALVGA